MATQCRSDDTTRTRPDEPAPAGSRRTVTGSTAVLAPPGFAALTNGPSGEEQCNDRVHPVDADRGMDAQIYQDS